MTADVGRAAFRRPDWRAPEVASLGLAGSLLVMPYAWTYEHALLLVPLILLFRRARAGWTRWSLWASLAAALPWALYWAATRTDSDVLSALVPAIVGLAYLAVAGTRSRAVAALAETEPGTEGTG